MNYNFSYRNYISLASLCLSIGNIIPLKDFYKKIEKKIIFRHDIDLSIDHALEIAKIDKRLGIKSTFMFIPNSKIYCIHDANVIKKIYKIKQLGHEIALHFDIEPLNIKEFNKKDINRIYEAIEHDKLIFKKIGIEIKSISFHRPVNELLYGKGKIFNLVNAYSKEAMQNYISDSGGRWASGSPHISIRKVKNFSSFQVLTHPIWWCHKNSTPRNTIRKFILKNKNLSHLIKDTVPKVYES